MRVLVTGGTGLIGRRLAQRLAARGDQPVILSRQADRARLNPALRGFEIVQGDPTVHGAWETAVSGCDAVVNLAGENLFARRWTSESRKRIRDSRVYATHQVVDAIAHAPSRPRVLVQASAIGYYGPRGDEELMEDSAPGTDFMALVCRDWEEAASAAEGSGTRVARVRIGVVLAPGEGALGVMVPIFKLFGAPVGSGGHWFIPAFGQQWLSWIHHEDVVGILLLALDNAEARGSINATAPNPVRNADFSRALTQTLRKRFLPRYIPFGPPDFLLRLVLGDVAEVITTGQRVLPVRAQALGYTFLFPDLESALRDVLGRRNGPRAPEPQTAAVAGSG